MTDRKEWELTDREVFASWRPDAPLESSQRSIATASARKALEWAAKRVAPLPDVDPTNDWERGYWAGENVSASLIRVELSE